MFRVAFFLSVLENAADGARLMYLFLRKQLVLEHSIVIQAPQSVVWRVTIDIQQWPEWTPTVKSVTRVDDGPFDLGGAAWIKQPGLPEAKWVVTELTPGERFTWETRVRGIRMIATHVLSTEAAGTRSEVRLEMSGVIARLLWPLIGVPARKTLERENAALKAKCEAVVS
jgi:uncharacterized membrane protein